MAASNPPTRPPTATELMNAPIVMQALAQAWIDSRADDPAQRHEEGGWIYMDLSTGDLTIQRAARGLTAAIDLSIPPLNSGSIVVGKFHTHPNPSAEGWNPGPSPGDRLVDDLHGAPDLIQAEDGIYLSGPTTRRGGLTGGPGYPP
jgi:hypothetical protein